MKAFYGKAPARAYWFGCSSGGYEGLQEAQRFPDDYDGIVAAAPANNFTRLMAGDFDAAQAVLKDPASNLPPAALGVLYRGVLAACDAKDGVSDGVVEDPRQCRFDPAALQCTANQKPEHLPDRRAGGSGAPGLSRPNESVGRTDIPRALGW